MMPELFKWLGAAGDVSTVLLVYIVWRHHTRIFRLETYQAMRGGAAFHELPDPKL